MFVLVCYMLLFLYNNELNFLLSLPKGQKLHFIFRILEESTKEEGGK